MSLSAEDEALLSRIPLDHHDWRGLKKLADAFDEFEPLAKRANLGPTVADRLVDKGLAEKGQCGERYARLGDGIGYRLTELGWKALHRGPARSKQPPRQKLRMLEPRLRALDTLVRAAGARAKAK